MADRQVKVTLSAQVQGYVEGMEKAAKATRETGSETEKLAQQQQAMETMGRSMLVAGGAMAAGLVLASKAAIGWDSAWAGVLKTVDGSPEELALVEQGLRDLTSVLPASHAEIAAVAEAAGQLGIQTPNVVAFTRTMIDLGETTNLSSQEAATAIARFTNIMGTSQDEVSNLGSALVDLGNNYATTEGEILNMSMRLAGAGKQIGMSEGDVLGLAAALSSVGIEAEAGGSAMSKVMIDIAAAVEDGGDRLEMFARVAGVSATDFAQKWRTNAGGALALFVEGLANAESQGSSTLGVLAELGITETRMRDALLRSASASDQFTKAMEQGNAAYEANTALAAEAEKRYETTASKLSIMGNKVTDAAISLGEHLLPAIERVAGGVGGFADLLSGLNGPMGAAVAWSGVLAAGILLTGGVALTTIPKIAALKVAAAELNLTAAAAGGKLRGIGTFLGGPWGIALGLATVSVAAFNASLDGSKSSAQELETAIKQSDSALETMLDKANQNETGLVSLFADLSHQFENLPALADKAATAGRGFFSSMSFNENAALDTIKELGSALATMAATNLPRAQRAFKEFVGDAGLNDTQALTFLNEEMAGFKSQLIDVAIASGLATDDATLLKIALGDIAPAAQVGTRATEANSTALAELQGKAAVTGDELSELADIIRGLGSAQLDLREANRRLEESYDDFTDAIKTNGWTLDTTTQKGRDNEAALDAMAEATLGAAAATLEQTGSQAEANAKLAEGRERIIDLIAPYFETRDAAAAYVDQLGLISPEKVTKLFADTQPALRSLQDYMDRYGTVYGTINYRASLPDLNGAASGGGRMGTFADGGVVAYANGGVQEFAGGGFPTGIYVGGAPIHKFAEPETGWEAYISGKPSERDRNRQIWSDTGERLGMGDVMRAAAAAASGGSGGGGMPSELVVIDSDGALIGRMRVEATQAVSSATSAVSRSSLRRDGGVY